MPRFPRSFCFAVLVLILPTLTGCTSWQTVDRPAPEVIEEHPGKKLRVVLVNGARFDADSARIRSDSLVAWRPQAGSSVIVPELHSLARVQAIQMRHYEPGRTDILVGGIVLLGVLVAAAVRAISDLDPWGS